MLQWGRMERKGNIKHPNYVFSSHSILERVYVMSKLWNMHYWGYGTNLIFKHKYIWNLPLLCFDSSVCPKLSPGVHLNWDDCDVKGQSEWITSFSHSSNLSVTLLSLCGRSHCHPERVNFLLDGVVSAYGDHSEQLCMICRHLSISEYEHLSNVLRAEKNNSILSLYEPRPQSLPLICHTSL